MRSRLLLCCCGLVLWGCPLAVEDPYEIGRPDAGSGGVGSGATGGSAGVSKPTCTDKVKNGNETGQDCGGADCPKCPVGEGCSSNEDCISDSCSSSTCRS
ncbi:MAG: hypothetical protein R3B13_36615 [Polyangiaceae bacterium]